MDTHAIILIQFHRPALLLGPSSHGGPAVGAVAAGTQPALPACRMEDEPVVAGATAPLQAYVSLGRSFSGLAVFCFLQLSETGLGNTVIGTHSSALATAGTTTGSVVAPSSALLAVTGSPGWKRLVRLPCMPSDEVDTAPKSVVRVSPAQNVADGRVFCLQ